MREKLTVGLVVAAVTALLLVFPVTLTVLLIKHGGIPSTPKRVAALTPREVEAALRHRAECKTNPYMVEAGLCKLSLADAAALQLRFEMCHESEQSEASCDDQELYMENQYGEG